MLITFRGFILGGKEEEKEKKKERMAAGAYYGLNIP